MIRKNINRALTLAITLSMILGSIGAPVSVFAATLDSVKTQTQSMTQNVSTGTQMDLIDSENKEDTENDEENDDDLENDEEGENEEIVIEWEDVHIKDANDLVDLAQNCKLDTWSQNKNVYLDDDISMTNINFTGIPTFGGFFDGQGHTISGLNISSDRSYLGFFSRIQGDGVVTNLNVSARVMPYGAQTIIGGIAGDNAGIITNCKFKGTVSGENYVGGIVGINELSGIILDTVSDGIISGTHFTGGIAGENMGNIMRCTNKAAVNITDKSTAMSIDDINIDSVLSMIGLEDKNKDEAEASAMVNGTVDMGGIAGVSVGVIQSCINDGNVGYTNVGYNVGGIAGRQSGYIYASTNNGDINGRKDVGGIVGQAEPYVTIDFANNITSQLSDNISKLHDILTVTLNDADSSSDTISARLAIIKNFTDRALDDTKYIENETIDWANGMVTSANEAISRIDYIMDEAAKKDGVMDKTNNAASDAQNAMKEFDNTVNDLDLEKYMTDSEKEEYNAAKKNMEDASTEFEGYEKEVDKSAAYNYSLFYYIGRSEYYGADDPSKTLGKNENDVTYKNGNTQIFAVTGVAGGVPTGTPVKSPKNMGESWNASDGGDNATYGVSGNWVHNTSEGDVSLGGTDDSNQNQLDGKLVESATAGAAELVKAYADKKYENAHGTGNTYASALSENGEIMAGIIAKAAPKMNDATRSDADKAVKSLESSMGNLKSAGEQAKSIISTINGKGDISLPTFSQEYKAHANSLTNNIQGMSDNFGLLNSEMNGASDTLINHLQGVNDQFNIIMQLFTDAIDGVLDNDYSNTYNDESLSVCDDTTDATIANCTNTGLVQGSIDVAGIAGTMAIEYDFDLESDVTGIKNAAMNTTYQTKCVLRNNTNRAEVASVKNYAGGVCGLQEMGTITGCQNYSRISSDTASYVGGIAGSSVSNIIKSNAKCTLSGKSYVGGIAGDGIKLYDNLAMVKIQDANEWYGAIAGHASDNEEIKRNYFFGSDLAGIDRVSYSGCAEPVSYSYAREILGDVPNDFNKMYVSFVCKSEDEDGNEVTNLIERKAYDYGQPLKEEDFPEVPNKEGYYGEWDIKSMDAVIYDEIITASYVRNNTTLAGDIVRGSNQSALLVDGSFREDDKLVTVLDVGNPDAMENCKEYWELTIPDDGQLNHQLRYMKADNMEKWPEIYVKENDSDWRRITEDDLGEMGAYRTFTVSGNDVKVQTIYSDAKAHLIRKILIIAGIIVGALVLIAINIVILRSRKRVHKRVQKRAQELREKSAAREPAIKFVEESEIDSVENKE